MHVSVLTTSAAMILATLTPSVAFAATPEASNSPGQATTAVTNEATVAPTTYEAESQADGSVLVSLTHGSFVIEDDQVKILNNEGQVLEKLPKILIDGSGNRFSVEYSMLDSSNLRIEQELPRFGSHTERSGWGDYGKCVGKNTIGGVVGGAVAGCAGGWLGLIPQACAAGAGAGAITGSIATGVGSLFWCW